MKLPTRTGRATAKLCAVWAIALSAAGWASAGAAQTVPQCRSDGSPDSCAPFYGCLLPEGDGSPIAFIGQAVGWNRGALTARTTAGATCEGDWWIEPTGAGRSAVVCSDGRSFETVQIYQDAPTGTAVAEGQSDRGEPVIAWTGQNAPDFLRGGLAPPAWVRACVDSELLG